MSRTRIALSAAGAVAALFTLAAIGAVMVARSRWFSEKVRERIVEEAAGAVNGRVEMSAFHFDWRTLTAQMDGLTIHGTEAAGQAPLLAVRRLVIGLKIVSLIGRRVDIASVEADAPQAHLIVQADGNLNIPPPHRLRPQMILDLRVGRFRLNNGVILAEAHGRESVTVPWNVKGLNLAARLRYDAAKERYDGDIHLSPLHFEWDGLAPVDARMDAHAGMEKNRFTISSATLQTAGSTIRLSGFEVNGFADPVTTAKYSAKLGLADVDRIFKLVNFRHSGMVEIDGAARFVSPKDYLISGAAQGTGISYGGVHGLSVSGKFVADPGKILLPAMQIDAAGGRILANAEVRDLKTFQLAGTLERFNIRDITKFGGMRPLPYNGSVSGPFKAEGTLSELDFHSLKVSARSTITPGRDSPAVHGDVTTAYDGKANRITFGESWIELPASRADFSGVPGERLDVRLVSKDVNELRAALAIPPSLRTGAVSFNGTFSGALKNPLIAGHATITNALVDDRKIESAAADFTANDASLTMTDASIQWGALQARVKGSLGLADWKAGTSSAVNASVQVIKGDLAHLLTLAGRKDLPVSGTLSATAQVTGTLGDPHANADATVTNGQLFGEPFDTATVHAQYLNSGAQEITAAVNKGPERLNGSARLNRGRLTFNASSNDVPLNQLAVLRKRQPDLRGMAQMKAAGTLEITEDSAHRVHARVLDLHGELSASALALGTRNLGDAHLTATTANDVLSARLESNAVNAAIHGDGTIGLTGDYPVDAQLIFSNVGLNAVEAMLIPSRTGLSGNLDGAIAGQVRLRGPARTPDLITAAMEISQFELRPSRAAEAPENLRTLALRNDGALRMTLAKSVVSIESARFTGPDTSVGVTGSIAMNRDAPLDLAVQGRVNLALAETFNQALTSAGEVVVNASLRGAFDKPDLAGRAELRNGDFRYAGLVNGMTNASGVVQFNGERATLVNFTAESGGGKVDATGFAALAGGVLGFRLDTKARAIRIRYPEGVSTLSDADLTFAGTSERSDASGKVTIRRIAINPTSDVARILAESSQPGKTPAAGAGLLAGMNLDIEIATAPDVAFETSVAQSVEAGANLRLRGTAANRALLGRINISQGELVFFGNKYTINQGSVLFLNPAKIDPVLNVSLETKARGVDVILTISGPIAKLNVSYRSDPPLQFGDIVALLATGRTPTNATLAASYTGQSGNFQQLGASALLGQALSNPTPDRLQRFFGVSNIKLDPQLSGITGSPEARLTIEQQVSPNILFTYVSDVTSTSTQLIRVEWDFNRRWGAILTRGENGYVGLDFAYKKRFK